MPGQPGFAKPERASCPDFSQPALRTKPWPKRLGARAGRFELKEVPPGTYELVCWHPNWHEARRDLDPELGMVLRLAYRPAVELTRTLTVESTATSTADFALDATLFAK